MTKFIQGNYLTLLQQCKLPSTFSEISDESKAKKQILLDLPRTFFFESNQKTFQDFVQNWISFPKQNSYTQGDMTGAVFSAIIAVSWALKLKEDADTYLENKKHISLAYFDDTGVLCGFSLYYFNQDPQKWAAAIIRNTTAVLEKREHADREREVAVLCSNDILGLNPNQSNVNQLAHYRDAFFKQLNCKELNKLLIHVFLDNGTVALKELNYIEQFTHPDPSEADHDLIRQLTAGISFTDVKPFVHDSILTDLKECYYSLLFFLIEMKECFYFIFPFFPFNGSSDKHVTNTDKQFDELIYDITEITPSPEIVTTLQNTIDNISLVDSEKKTSLDELINDITEITTSPEIVTTLQNTIDNIPLVDSEKKTSRDELIAPRF